jgi:hypothetical protein
MSTVGATSGVTNREAGVCCVPTKGEDPPKTALYFDRNEKYMAKLKETEAMKIPTAKTAQKMMGLGTAE